MKKVLVMALLALFVLPAMSMAQAQPGTATQPAAQPQFTGPGDGGERGAFFVFPGGPAGTAIGVAVGLGLLIFGAARGIGSIGSHAVDSIARQPEAGGRIFTSMIISAALIEGATLFAILVVFLRS
jgi:F-type H+-transporting ATPase subunit c